MIKMNNIYLTCTNNKRFNEWAKQNKNKLTGRVLDHFNAGYAECVNGSYFARATFVCYWEIYSNGSLAKIAPSTTQATLIHMLHRFLEQGKHEEVEVISLMMSNFLRLLQKIDETEEE